jgi:hypothetical protein
MEMTIQERIEILRIVSGMDDIDIYNIHEKFIEMVDLVKDPFDYINKTRERKRKEHLEYLIMEKRKKEIEILKLGVETEKYIK